MPIGPGGLDPNGIWQYGEDDSEALASDLLNLGMSSVSTALSSLGGGFDSSVTITATDAAWAVPTLGSPIVKITAVGGGGGGGGGAVNQGRLPQGGDGGTTTVVCSAGTITAVGGLGANGGGANTGNPGFAGTDGLSAGNHGSEGLWSGNSYQASGATGLGGQITVGYLDLTGVSSLNITVGAGGAGGTRSGSVDGGPGGRGEVVIEYVAG